jgi:hypothetical protein
VDSLRAHCYATVRSTHLCSSELTRNNRGSGVFCESAPRLYNEDLTQLKLEFNRELSSARINEKRQQFHQRIELSSGVGSWQNNGKEGIRLCKEDFMCDLK